VVNNVKFDGKSNPWKWTPAFPNSTRVTLDNMTVQRAGYALVPQADGTVLYFGGGDDGLAASYGQRAVDQYSPATQTFSPRADMIFPRSSHTATALLNGKILLAGGADDGVGEPTAFVEVYDPVSNSSVAVQSMSIARALHTANLLPDGRVLIAGGTTSFNSPQDIVTNSLRTTEIFNPATHTWSAGPLMAEPRVGHTATTLVDNRILFAGGFSWINFITIIPFVSDKYQLYTPNTGIGAFTSNATMATGDRFGHTAIRLDNGDVWLIGGAQDQLANPFDPVATNTIAQYHVASNTFTITASMTIPRGVAAAARLPNGNIAIAGGAWGSLSVPTPDPSIDILDQTGVLFGLFNMQHERANFFAATLCDGTVLLAGGGEYADQITPSLVWSYDDAEILHP
jgi:Kelch motif